MSIVENQADSPLQASPKTRRTQFSRLNRQPGPEIFTKFADVKSRISWTADRQQLLREMWDRGDKASIIAEALGCKVGAVNVARDRFKLTPRRIVSGRPKEPDEPAHRIERVAFTTSRLMEFCTEKELVAQTGHEAYLWPLVVLKELVDNGADACEEAGVAPVIKVMIKTGNVKSRRRPAKPTRIVVEDNGPGIPPEMIAGIIDYNVQSLVTRDVHQSDQGTPRQRPEDHPGDGLRARQRGQGQDLDRGAWRQASHPVLGQPDQARADRQEYPDPFPGHDRDAHHHVLAGHRRWCRTRLC